MYFILLHMTLLKIFLISNKNILIIILSCTLIVMYCIVLAEMQWIYNYIKEAKEM